ncbi:hypothetical protein PSHT_09261 [Puccinia striiformis]|uniref:Uncharacterized protein n=1 Tax=Puccinia striiformis TaxID=27350 RepID=A0A2S4VI02_9BASI|nr:hypothetical protein PSHT_09261 [Puccinia striiformis]
MLYSPPQPPGLNSSRDSGIWPINPPVGHPGAPDHTLDPLLADMNGPGNLAIHDPQPTSGDRHFPSHEDYYYSNPSNPLSSNYPVQHQNPFPPSSTGSAHRHDGSSIVNQSVEYWGSHPIHKQFTLPHSTRSEMLVPADNPPAHDPVGNRPGNPPPQAAVPPRLDDPPKTKRQKRGNNHTNNVDLFEPHPPAKTQSQAPRKPRAKKPRDMSSLNGRKDHELPNVHPTPVSAPPRSAIPHVPNTDGRHHPHPATHPAGAIAALECAANTLESFSNSLNQKSYSHILPAATVPVPRPTPPLAGVSDPRPKKNLKHLRSREEDGLGVLPVPQPHAKLMAKSIGNLVAQAQEGSKGAMSNDDRAFFVQFQAEQRQMLAIKSIERGVSVAMVDKYLGQCHAMRNVSDWNLFLKTEAARERFCGAGKGGIAQHHPMAEIGVMWEEAGKQLPPDFVIDGKPVDRLTSSERALDNEVGNCNPTASINSVPALVSPPALRGTVSMSTAAGQVQDFLDRWVLQANRVAQTFKCEMILFTVSKYLGADSYSLATTTHGATAFANLANKLDGQNTYATRFHAWAVGHSADHIASLADPEQAIVNRPRSLKFTERMSRLLARKTEGVLTQWPWTTCEVKLAKAGFHLKLDHRLEIRKLHLDLDDKYIDVVRMSPSSVCSADSSRSQSQVSSLRASSESLSQSSSHSSLQSSSVSEHQSPASPIHPPSPSALGSLQDAEFSEYSSDSSENLPSF